MPVVVIGTSHDHVIFHPYQLLVKMPPGVHESLGEHCPETTRRVCDIQGGTVCEELIHAGEYAAYQSDSLFRVIVLYLEVVGGLAGVPDAVRRVSPHP